MGQILLLLLQAVGFLVLARCLLSFVVQDWSQQPMRLVHQLTEPLLQPIRGVLPPLGGIDLSPLVLCVAIYAVSQALAGVVGG